jgi:hypothetical protein
MAQRFYQGRTNNHLTWVMVDATDFATPESALSAATKIKVYGKLQGQTGVYFVSSGAGSLTNDIQHVGASALGLYTIALAKADLSDASAAWYDQYVISLSATGAAYQTIVAEGVLAGANISNVSAALSDTYSLLTPAASRVLLIQSRLSDLDSRLVSDISDILSSTRGLSDFQSKMSDIVSNINSMLIAGTAVAAMTASDMSDLRSAIGAVAVTIGPSDISDIASAVIAGAALTASQVWAYATRKLTSNINLNASDMSDLRSAITAGGTATVSASDISDIASAVWANTIGTRVDSRLLKVLSDTSDALSSVRGISDILSKVYAHTTGISDVLSNVHGDLANLSSVGSDIYSLLSSRVTKKVATDSQLSGLASDIESSIASALSDINSTITSATAGVTVNSASARLIADSLLNRDIAGGGSGNTRNVRNALRSLRNKVIMNADSTVDIMQENDTTVAWSAAYSTAAGNPLVKVDP